MNKRWLQTVAVVGGLLVGGSWTRAQQPFVENPAIAPAAAPTATPVSFAFDLGHIAQDEGGTHSIYALKATQPWDSKLTGQIVRIVIDDTNPQGNMTRLLSLRTGKHKTVAQTCEAIREAFRQYQRVGAGANGQIVGKIGDLRYGGEMRFVAESPTVLRCDMQTEGQEDHATKLSAGDVAVLVALLAERTEAGER